MHTDEKKRNQYSEDFKRDIVKKCTESRMPVQVFAQQVGIDQSMLHRWVKKYAVFRRMNGPSDLSIHDGLKNEVEELRIEIDKIRQSVEILRDIVEKSFCNRYEISD